MIPSNILQSASFVALRELDGWVEIQARNPEVELGRLGSRPKTRRQSWRQGHSIGTGSS